MNPAGYRLLLADTVPLGVLSLFRPRPFFPWLLPWSLPSAEGSGRYWPVARGYADRARASAAGGLVTPYPLPTSLTPAAYEPSVERSPAVGKLSLGWVGKRLYLTSWGDTILWRALDGASSSPLSPFYMVTYTRIPGYSPSS